jgi:hypothetical protein
VTAAAAGTARAARAAKVARWAVRLVARWVAKRKARKRRLVARR